MAGQDDLSFYPVIYWPLQAGSITNPAAVSALNDYMRHGGLLLIDTGDGGATPPAALQAALSGLDVPPLHPLGTGDLLARSFYLLRNSDGVDNQGSVWIANLDPDGGDATSPLILGGANWTRAWQLPVDGPGDPANAPYRFGTNVVMYVLTGTYKADQSQAPALLQRLKENRF